MNPFKKKYTIIKEDELQKLWDKARSFGRIGVFTSNSGHYSVTINFPQAVMGSELKVTSPHNIHETLKEALLDCIEKAEELKKQFK